MGGKKTNKEFNRIMQELCLEYKNVEYDSFFLKALNDFLKKKKKVEEGEGKLKIRSHIEENKNLFMKFGSWEVYRISLSVWAMGKHTCCHL